MHVDRSWADRGVAIPDMNEQLIATEDTILVRHEEQQQSILTGCQGDELAIDTDAMTDMVDGNAAGRKRLAIARRRLLHKTLVYPGQQPGHVCGLAHENHQIMLATLHFRQRGTCVIGLTDVMAELTQASSDQGSRRCIIINYKD